MGANSSFRNQNAPFFENPDSSRKLLLIVAIHFYCREEI
jgi:hypothetical protein